MRLKPESSYCNRRKTEWGILFTGERQRAQLAHKPPRHPRSVRTLSNVFQHLVEQGATVVATDHDLDFKQPPKPRQAQAAPPRTQCSKP